MKRRSKAGDEPIKGRRRKAAKPERRDAPETAPRSKSSPTSEDTVVARLTRERRETTEQHTATSEILRVISSSPSDLQPVFQAMLKNAAQLCDAKFGNIYRWDGDALHLVATQNVPAAFVQARGRLPLRPSRQTPTGRVIATKTMVHAADMRAEKAYADRDPYIVAGVELGGVRTALVVPMLKDDELIGTFSVYRQEVRPFTDKQIELVKNFAAQAVIAIENARLLSELRQRTAELTERTTDLTEALEQQTATSEVLQVVSSSPSDLQPVFVTMLENAVRICGATFGNIFRWDGEAFHLVAAHKTPPAFAKARKASPLHPVATSHFGRLLKTKSVVHTPDLSEEQQYVEERRPAYVEAVELGGIKTFLAVPMLKDDELIGAFGLFRQEVRPFTDKQIALVRTSPRRQLSPSRTRACSTSSDSRWSSRPLRRRYCRSSADHRVIWSQYLRQCWPTRCASVTPSSAVSIVGQAELCASSQRAMRPLGIPKRAEVWLLAFRRVIRWTAR